MSAVTRINKPKLEVKKHKAEVTDYGSYPAREYRTLTYTGVIGGQKFTLRVNKRSQYYVGPGRNPYARGSYTYSDRGYNKRPIIYFDFADESVFENFAHRESRPVHLMGKAARRVLAALFENPGRIGWNKNAGCGMCPCSPGFVWGDAPAIDFEDGRGPTTRYDVWLEVEGMPKVDTDDPAKVRRMNQRAAALNDDPTIPVTLEPVYA